jgi:tetratricopeptide (TPR) repeat protein
MSQDLKSQIQELLEVEDYEQVLEILQDNTDPELLPFRVEALMETDQFEEAADLLRPLTVDPKAPSPAWAWMWRGFLHYELDEQEDAKEAFTLALKREPRNVKALIGRALVYRELDFDRAAGLDLDKAMMVLGEVTPETEDPEQRRLKANIHNLRADFALDEDKADVALAELRTAAALVPDDPDYALDLARLLSLQGEVEAAVEACDQAIEGDEGFIEAYLLRSYLMGVLGNGDEALASAHKALEVDPEEAFNHLQLASALVLKGDFEAALASARAAIEADPDLPDGYQLAAAALETLGRAEEITEEMRAYFQETAQLPSFLYGERFDPYSDVARVMDEMGAMDPDELRRATEQLFAEGVLPEAFRPMMEQVIQNLPELLQNMPPEMLQGFNPAMLQQLSGGQPPAIAPAPTGLVGLDGEPLSSGKVEEAGKPRSPFTIIQGGKDK